MSARNFPLATAGLPYARGIVLLIMAGAGYPATQGFVETVTDTLLGASAEAIGTAKLQLDAAIFAVAVTSCVAHSGK
jgi:hypothetical protein